MFGHSIFGNTTRLPDAQVAQPFAKTAGNRGQLIPVTTDIPRQIPIVAESVRTNTGGRLPIVADQPRLLPVSQVDHFNMPITRRSARTEVGGHDPVPTRVEAYSGLGATAIEYPSRMAHMMRKRFARHPGAYTSFPRGYTSRPAFARAGTHGFGQILAERTRGRSLFPPQVWQMGPPTMSSFAGPDGLAGLIGIGG